MIAILIFLGKVHVEIFGGDMSIGGNPQKLVPFCLVTAGCAWLLTKRKWLIGSNPLSKYVLVFVAANVLTFLFSQDMYGSAKDVFRILMAVAFFDLVCQVYPGIRNAWDIGLALIVGYVFLIAISATEVLQGAWRISGPLRYPTILGGLLVMALPVLLARLLLMSTQLTRSLYLLLFVSGVLILLGTLSRGAYFGFVVSMVVLLAITREKRLLVLALAGILLVLPAVQQKVHNRMKASYRDTFELGDINRKNIWLGTFEILDDPRTWLVGVGKGDGFTNAFNDLEARFKPGQQVHRVAHPHNIFLYYLVTGGLIGLGSFLFLLYGLYSLFSILLKASPTRADRWTTGALAASIAGILAQNMVDCTLLYRSLPLLFWLIVAAAVAQAKQMDITRVI